MVDYEATPKSFPSPYDPAALMVREFEAEEAFKKAVEDDVLEVLNQHLEGSIPSTPREEDTREEDPECEVENVEQR